MLSTANFFVGIFKPLERYISSVEISCEHTAKDDLGMHVVNDTCLRFEVCLTFSSKGRIQMS